MKTHRGRWPYKWSEASIRQGVPRIAGRHPDLEEARKSMAPGIPCGLQNCERIHFCCLKLPSFWYFVTAALGN